MENNGQISPSSVAIGILVVFFCLLTAYLWYSRRNTVPVPSYYDGFVDQKMPGSEKKGVVQGAMEASEWFDNPPGKRINPIAPIAPIATATVEHFGGVSHGSGSPDCLRTSSEGSELVAMFSGRKSRMEEGPDDLRELTQIVGKLSCFKKDLLSPSFTVNATLDQPFVTMHDIEPIAETTGRCFTKVISPRDLEIAFDKWNSRGDMLVRRLCTSYTLSPPEVEKAQALYNAVLRDVKDVARSACLQGEPIISGKPGPRDPHPYENPDMESANYTGYY